MLKPVKKALLLIQYQDSGMHILHWTFSAPQVELIAKEINMAIALMAAVVFARLARHFRREQLVYVVMTFFIALCVAYSIALADPGAVTAWLFYLSGDLFVTLNVAAFFVFLNDSEEPLSARKVYGLVGLGGVVGGFFGSGVIAANATQLNADMVALICAGAGIVILLIAYFCGYIVRHHPPRRAFRSALPAGRTVKDDGLLEGLRLVVRSPYLLNIAAIIALYEIISTLIDYQFTSTVVHFVAPDAIGRYLSQVYHFTNFSALVVQLFVTRYVLIRYGVGTALLFLPVSILICSGGFLVAPVLLLGSLLNTADNALSYSIQQSAKEVLYVPVVWHEKYQAKAFIDIFVLRLAKALAVVLSLALSALFAGFDNLRWLSLITLCLLGLWLLAVRQLSRDYQTHEHTPGPPTL